MVGRIAKYLPKKILRQVTHALIVSQVNYCAADWGNAGVGEISRLQAAQNKAARIILRCSNDTPIEEGYKQPEWSYISYTIARNVLQLFYNLHAKNKPELLISRFQQVKDRHLVSTRAASTSDYVLPRTRLVIGKRTLCFQAVKLWNRLPDLIRNLPEKHFKQNIRGIFLRSI